MQPVATFVNCVYTIKFHSNLGSQLHHLILFFHLRPANQSTIMGVDLCLQKVADPYTNRHVVASRIKSRPYSYGLLAMICPTARKMGDHFTLACINKVHHKVHPRTNQDVPDGGAEL